MILFESISIYLSIYFGFGLLKKICFYVKVLGATSREIHGFICFDAYVTEVSVWILILDRLIRLTEEGIIILVKRVQRSKEHISDPIKSTRVFSPSFHLSVSAQILQTFHTSFFSLHELFELTIFMVNL